MSNYSPSVSIVIPIFNVETYIERCLHSLFNQTLKDIEFIFIDDGSNDKSIPILRKVLNSYPERKNQVKILIHPENRGVAAARTTGILSATGEYIIHCDPDDYIELNMYELLYNKAKKSNADIIMCSIFIESEKTIKKLQFNYNGSSKKYLENGILNQFVYASLFNKLIKRKIIIDNSIFPFEDCDYGEDLGCTVRILYYAKSISKVELPLYHYCIRGDSITGGNRILTYELFKQKTKLVDNICIFFKDKGYDTLCNRLKFNLKWEGRIFYRDNLKEWGSLYSECHKDILKFKDNSLKMRVLWYFALNNIRIYKLLHFINNKF